MGSSVERITYSSYGGFLDPAQLGCLDNIIGELAWVEVYVFWE